MNSLKSTNSEYISKFCLRRNSKGFRAGRTISGGTYIDELDPTIQETTGLKVGDKIHRLNDKYSDQYRTIPDMEKKIDKKNHISVIVVRTTYQSGDITKLKNITKDPILNGTLVKVLEENIKIPGRWIVQLLQKPNKIMSLPASRLVDEPLTPKTQQKKKTQQEKQKRQPLKLEQGNFMKLKKFETINGRWKNGRIVKLVMKTKDFPNEWWSVELLQEGKKGEKTLLVPRKNMDRL